MVELFKKKYSKPEIEFVFSFSQDIMSYSTNTDDNVGSDDEGWSDWG